MKKVLFLIPPHMTFDAFVHPAEHNAKIITKQDGKQYGNILTETPLGYLSLSAYLKKHCDVTTNLIDFNVLLYKLNSFYYDSFAEFFEDMLGSYLYDNDDPDIICISTLFITAYKSTIDLAKLCKAMCPNTILILGGGVPTNLYKQFYKDCEDIDAICYGEGELPLVELVTTGEPLNTSWITKQRFLCDYIPKYNFVQNLDEIPRADYNIIRLDDYSHPGMSSYSGTRDDKSVHYMTTRGCRHNCTFCASRSVHGNKIRQHSLERIKSDLEYFKSLGIKTIIFQDDDIMFNKDRFKTILSYFKELNMTPFFQNGLAMHSLSRDILIALKDVGTEHLVLSVESGCERVLKDIMHKPLNKIIISQVVKDCRELGLYTGANVIFGLPGETKAEMDESVEFLKNVGINWFKVFVFSPLVGSQLYQLCNQKGYIGRTFLDGDYKHPTVVTEEFDEKYMSEKIYEINLLLNFICNYDFAVGKYEDALKGFQLAICARPDHALAYYYSSRCYEALHQEENAIKYMKSCMNILATSIYWNNVFMKYGVHTDGD